MVRTLPDRFRALAPFVEKWAQPSERDRFFALTASTIDEVRVFHDAMLPRSQEIADYLDQYPVGGLPTDAQALFDLLMTFVEVGHTIDLNWRGTDIEDSFPVEKMEFLAPSSGPAGAPNADKETK